MLLRVPRAGALLRVLLQADASGSHPDANCLPPSLPGVLQVNQSWQECHEPLSEITVWGSH
jgi:hypothetical protein